MFGAPGPISGAMPPVTSAQPMTKSTPEASRLPEATKLAVPVVVGTRPEAIKVAPVILALRESQCLRPVVVSTGQHHRMVREIFDLAGITTDVERRRLVLRRRGRLRWRGRGLNVQPAAISAWASDSTPRASVSTPSTSAGSATKPK